MDQDTQGIDRDREHNIQEDDPRHSVKPSLLSQFNPDPYPSSNKEAQTNIALAILCEKSRDLLLHLSCVAPLAPLAVNAPYSSSLTGFEILEKEITSAFNHFGKSSGVGSARHRVQCALDRSRSEQMTLIRCKSISYIIRIVLFEYQHAGFLFSLFKFGIHNSYSIYSIS